MTFRTAASKALSDMGPAFVGGMDCTTFDEYLRAIERESLGGWMEFTEPMVEGLHGLHSAIAIEACDVERCRAWVALRSEGSPTADEVRGILK